MAIAMGESAVGGALDLEKSPVRLAATMFQ